MIAGLFDMLLGRGDFRHWSTGMGIGNIDVLVPGFAHVGNIENMPSWKNILTYRVCIYI